MRKIKEVLRLKYELGLGQRQIARSCAIGLGSVNDYLVRAERAGIRWPLPEGWEEPEVEAALFGAEPAQTREPERAVPDFAAIHQQRQTKRFVTLQLLWQEYRETKPLNATQWSVRAMAAPQKVSPANRFALPCCTSHFSTRGFDPALA